MSRPLAELSVAELKNQEKQQSTVLYAFIGLISVMAVAGGVITYLDGFTVFTVLPIAFLPLVIIFSTKLKKTKAEISARD